MLAFLLGDVTITSRWKKKSPDAYDIKGSFSSIKVIDGVHVFLHTANT